VLDLNLGPAFYIGTGDASEFDGIGPAGALAIGYQF